MKQYFSSDFNFLPSNYKLLDYFSFFPLHRCVFLFCKAPIPVGGAPMWKEFYSVLKELFSESSSMPREFSIFTVKHNEIFFAMKKYANIFGVLVLKRGLSVSSKPLKYSLPFGLLYKGTVHPILALPVTMPLDAKCWHAEIYDCNFS